MPATYLTNQTLGTDLISEAFTQSKFFGEYWIIAALLTIVTLFLITRNTTKFKMLTLPVLMMWDIAGLEVGVALYTVAGLMYVLAMLETGAIQYMINATSLALGSASASVSETTKSLIKGETTLQKGSRYRRDKKARAIEDRQKRIATGELSLGDRIFKRVPRLAQKAQEVEEMKIASLNKLEQKKLDKITMELAKKEGYMELSGIQKKMLPPEVLKEIEKDNSKALTKVAGIARATRAKAWTRIAPTIDEVTAQTRPQRLKDYKFTTEEDMVKKAMTLNKIEDVIAQKKRQKLNDLLTVKKKTTEIQKGKNWKMRNELLRRQLEQGISPQPVLKKIPTTPLPKAEGLSPLYERYLKFLEEDKKKRK